MYFLNLKYFLFNYCEFDVALSMFSFCTCISFLEFIFVSIVWIPPLKTVVWCKQRNLCISSSTYSIQASSLSFISPVSLAWISFCCRSGFLETVTSTNSGLSLYLTQSAVYALISKSRKNVLRKIVYKIALH